MKKRRTFNFVIRNSRDGTLYGYHRTQKVFRWYYYNSEELKWVPCTARSLFSKWYTHIANNVIIK